MSTLEERFWAKVDKSGGPDACWPWTAYRNVDGYGVFRTPRNIATGMVGAHRVAFMLATGAQGLADKELKVRHRCNRPACCNPSHLELGTQHDNVRDAVKAQRQSRPTGEANPRAKLTAEEAAQLRHVAHLYTLKELSEIFGISITQVCRVRDGESWRHV